MWKRIVMGILVLVSIAAGFGVAKVQVTINQSLGHIKRSVDTSLDSVDLSGIHVESDDDIVNILLIGNDYRTRDGSQSPALKDVIMIATMDRKHNTLKLSSIMRDTLVNVAGQDKLMKVNASGKKEYGGIKNLYKTLAQNFNVKVDGYAEIGFDAFEDTVDAVGGVEVELTDTEVRYLNKTNYIWKKKNRNLKEGKQKLNGDQALAYCRIRKGYDVIGEPVVTVSGLTDDYGRTWRQRTLLTAVFDKMKSQPISKWIDVANKVLDNVTTDLDNDTIMEYMKDVVMMGTTEIHQMQIPMNGYFREDKENEFKDAQGWSLVPTNGVSSAYDPTANAEALRKFIFRYDGKKEFTYESEAKKAAAGSTEE